jgi:L-ascorbate metabolism protein UlaG (beta-lactamase superfamily)
MKTLTLLLSINFLTFNFMGMDYSKDVFDTGSGDLAITFIGHGTLMFEYRDMVIHIDPTMQEADYANLPDADMILITHHHGDHLDLTAINHIVKHDCPVIMTQTCLDQLEDFKGAVVMENGDEKTIKGIRIQAVPAYNIEHKRSNGQAFHPKGIGNAYVVSIGDLNVLIGGDTENVPEIKALKDIDIAFLPMNLPYTMTPEMVADAAKAIQPKILYPYHFGKTDPELLVNLLKDENNIEVRIRDLQ